jgi:hypothetical protein
MKELTKDDIKKILEEYKTKFSSGIAKESINKDVKEILNTFFESKAVLGFDIIQYSQYPIVEQTLIPHLFKELYNFTIDNCLNLEPFIFHSKTREDFTDYFIDPGDGGFQIFDNPFQAVVFSIYFQSNVKRYNSGKSLPLDILRIVGEIILRYSLTYDSIYCYSNNYYGPSIIRNARIMAKDKLNRFLIDDNTVAWFTKEFNGIETLQILTFAEDFKNINLFKGVKKNESITEQTLLFGEKSSKILKVDLLRIGEIKSKLDTISVHSLHIQIQMMSSTPIPFNKYTISIGNLNSTGITE